MLSLDEKKVLITGAAGFIGANLVARLVSENTKVFAVVRKTTDLWRLQKVLPEIKIYFADLTDAQAVKKIVSEVEPDVVINAAISYGHPKKDQLNDCLNSSILAVANLLTSLINAPFKRFIQIGSSLEYGFRDKPLKETDFLEPTTARGVAKAAATLLCQQFAYSHNMPIVILRPFSVYGYFEDQRRFIPKLIDSALNNNEMSLTQQGFYRDHVFIDDLVDACILAINTDAKSGEIINIGSGIQHSNEDVVQIVEQIIGRKISINDFKYPSNPPDTSHWVADCAKSKEILGWTCSTSLKEGLQKTLEWFKARNE